MTSAPETYRLFAVKYATQDRDIHATLMETEQRDSHDLHIPIDYFVWAAVSDARTVVIDTGFGAPGAKKYGRDLIRTVDDGLKMIGVTPSEVEDVIITHLHYDHVGNFDLFPKATFHLQDREMAFATGRHMGRRHLQRPFFIEDVVGMVREVYAGRVKFHDGDAAPLPGLELLFIGGHSAGLQAVRVWTGRGWVVLASDAAHLYENLDDGNPFPIVYHMGQVLDGYDRVREMAESPDHVIPGHDPLVLEVYPPAGPGLEGIAARLDVAPKPRAQTR